MKNPNLKHLYRTLATLQDMLETLTPDGITVWFNAQKIAYRDTRNNITGVTIELADTDDAIYLDTITRTLTGYTDECALNVDISPAFCNTIVDLYDARTDGSWLRLNP